MKKQIEVDACDFCNEHKNDYLKTCKVCNRLFCPLCALDDTWRFTDTPLCRRCGEIVWKKFPKFIKEISEKVKEDKK